MKPLAVLCAAVLSAVSVAGPARAHPHMFIDTGIDVMFDASGAVTGLRITWTYDELSSMQIIADLGLDPDFDGKLTEAELAELNGFDMQWEEGIAGDTYALMNGQGLALSRPVTWTASYDGVRITTTHDRSLDAPVTLTEAPLLVKVYDETLYTAYHLVGETGLAGGKACSARVVMPDLDAADLKLQAALAALPADVEVEYPALGAEFAEGVEIRCGAPS